MRAASSIAGRGSRPRRGGSRRAPPSPPRTARRLSASPRSRRGRWWPSPATPSTRPGHARGVVDGLVVGGDTLLLVLGEGVPLRRVAVMNQQHVLHRVLLSGIVAPLDERGTSVRTHPLVDLVAPNRSYASRSDPRRAPVPDERDPLLAHANGRLVGPLLQQRARELRRGAGPAVDRSHRGRGLPARQTFVGVIERPRRMPPAARPARAGG
jgi:hypothetical protein